MGNLRDTVVGTGQQLLAGLYPYSAQIAHGRAAEAFGKGMHHVIFIQVGNPGKAVQGYVSGVVGFDILFYFNTFMA